MDNNNYNTFFYATVCHVCKQFGEGIRLQRCGACGMIAYCSQQHQRQHWPQHKHLCKAIRDVFSNYKVKNRDVTEGDWAWTRMNLMLLVTLKLTRRLKVYEEEMFRYPRVCWVCREDDSRLLEDCESCRAVSFCTKHQDDSKHKNTCDLLKLCLNSNISAMNIKRKSVDLNYLQCVSAGKINDFQHMNDFVNTYMSTQSCLGMSSNVLAADQSEYLTRPLTLLYGMQVLDYVPKCKSLVVHVIGANKIEMATLEAWEVLLHLVPAVTFVKIIMIGPEVLDWTLPLDICNNCMSQNKKLAFECYEILYEDYLNSPAFAKPDLVVGFNAGIHEHEIASPRDTWTSSIQALAKQNYPLILSCYTQDEKKLEIDRISDILGDEVDYVYCGENPFASLRPYRDYETEYLFFQNNYVIVYRSLCT